MHPKAIPVHRILNTLTKQFLNTGSWTKIISAYRFLNTHMTSSWAKDPQCILSYSNSYTQDPQCTHKAVPVHRIINQNNVCIQDPQTSIHTWQVPAYRILNTQYTHDKFLHTGSSIHNKFLRTGSSMYPPVIHVHRILKTSMHSPSSSCTQEHKPTFYSFCIQNPQTDLNTHMISSCT